MESLKKELELKRSALESVLNYSKKEMTFALVYKLTNWKAKKKFSTLELWEIWDDFDNKISFKDVLNFLESYNILLKYPIHEEFIYECYLTTYNTLVTSKDWINPELYLKKLLVTRFKPYIKCKDGAIYKYIFGEYSSKRGKGCLYGGGWKISQLKAQLYLEEIIKSYEKRIS